MESARVKVKLRRIMKLIKSEKHKIRSYSRTGEKVELFKVELWLRNSYYIFSYGN